MPSPFTTSQLSQASNMLDQVWDTFDRPVTYYKTPVKTILATSPAFNYAFSSDDNKVGVTVQNVPVSGQFNAVVTYINSEDAAKLSLAEGNAKFKVGKGVLKVSVQQDGRAILLNALKIEVDGHSHVVVSDEQPRGLFAPNYYDFWLQKSD